MLSRTRWVDRPSAPAASQGRPSTPFVPVGPIRPVDQGRPAARPIVPSGFRPDGEPHENPSAAGVLDALLGGTAHRRADRRCALAILLAWPEAPAAARATREFQGRAIRFAARMGIRQFLALGGGARTIEPVHEAAGSVAAESRTVYVVRDARPITQLRGDPRAAGVTVVRADASSPAEVLHHPEVLGRFDLGRPIAVVTVAGLAEVADRDDPREVLRGYREATPRGSLLIFSQVCDEGSAQGLRELFEQSGQPGNPRTHAQTVELVNTWEPIEPGLVPADEWHAPDEHPRPHAGRLPVYASVGWH
jgi:hypothetical protein